MRTRAGRLLEEFRKKKGFGGRSGRQDFGGWLGISYEQVRNRETGRTPFTRGFLADLVERGALKQGDEWYTRFETVLEEGGEDAEESLEDRVEAASIPNGQAAANEEPMGEPEEVAPPAYQPPAGAVPEPKTRRRARLTLLIGAVLVCMAGSCLVGGLLMRCAQQGDFGLTATGPASATAPTRAQLAPNETSTPWIVTATPGPATTVPTPVVIVVTATPGPATTAPTPVVIIVTATTPPETATPRNTATSRPPTGTPTATRTPTITKTPTRDPLLFADNFDGGLSPDWRVISGQWRVVNGEISTPLDHDTASYLLVGEPDWHNYSVELKVYYRARCHWVLGVLVAAKDTDNAIVWESAPCSGSTLSIRKNGKQSVLVAGGGVRDGSRLRLDVKDGFYFGYIDGRQVFSVNDDTYGAGLVGFGIGCYVYPGCTMSVDDFSITALE